MHNIILLGPPGSGKSTQARALVDRFAFEHIETGTVLRQAAEADTPLGREIDRLIHTEKVLVPDDIVAPALEAALRGVSSSKGVILDGAPRRITQVPLVESVFARVERLFDHVVFVRIDEATAVARIASRFYCISDHHPLILGTDIAEPTDLCPICWSDIEQRKDDTPEGVRKRFSVFMTETIPVIEHYREAGKLIEVDGTQHVDSIREQIILQLER